MHFTKYYFFTGGAIGKNYSKVRLLLLNPTLEGKDRSRMLPASLDMLNKSLKYHPKTGQLWLGIERKIVDTSLVRGGGLHVGEGKRSKLALVEDDPVPERMFISYFLENVAVGQPKIIAGHLTLIPLVIQRNFFYDQFLSGIEFTGVCMYKASFDFDMLM